MFPIDFMTKGVPSGVITPQVHAPSILLSAAKHKKKGIFSVFGKKEDEASDIASEPSSPSSRPTSIGFTSTSPQIKSGVVQVKEKEGRWKKRFLMLTTTDLIVFKSDKVCLQVKSHNIIVTLGIGRSSTDTTTFSEFSEAKNDQRWSPCN